MAEQALPKKDCRLKKGQNQKPEPRKAEKEEKTRLFAQKGGKGGTTRSPIKREMGGPECPGRKGGLKGPM